MIDSSGNGPEQATDAALDDYWAMYLRAERLQTEARDQVLPLQEDHHKRTYDLAELHRRKEAIERDINAQEAMLRTVAARIGELNSQAEQARRVGEMHAATVARMVQETGRPHPKTRFEAANRQVIAERLTHEPIVPGEMPVGPPAAAPPPASGEPPVADSTPSRGLRFLGTRHTSNGPRP